MKNIAINGFGRIGRLTFRNLMQRKNLNVSAINDLTDINTLAHLLKYDSVQGKYPGEVQVDGSALIVDGHRIEITAERDPSNLPWNNHNIDLVVESTGRFLTTELAQKHIDAGAKRVLLSAPAKSADIPTFVLGVNDSGLTDQPIVSNASCTTNCGAPMTKVIHDHLVVERGFLTTVHAYTSDQNILDAPHADLRRARAAALSIIPTRTGAAKAIGLVMPSMQGKIDGVAARVPTPTGSFTQISFQTEKTASIEEIMQFFKEAAASNLKGVLEYSEDPLVSTDIIGNPHSCIFDATLTKASENLITVFGWYDNEMGYATRMADMTERMTA